VPANATLGTVAKGLANAVNLQSGITHVSAIPLGDRVELQSLQVFVPGTNATTSASTSIGFTSILTARLTAARPTCLDTVAKGYQVVTFYNAPAVGDWIQITFTKTNGTLVTLGVTNNVSGTTIGAMAQNLVNLINATPALQTADGAVASDFIDQEPAAQFYLYARAPGWPASQILTTLNTSADLQATPIGTNPLADNVSDLRPRNHLYVSSGTNSLAVNYGFDTTQISDGYHQLTAVAYEGSSVATQTRVTRNVLVQNTNLSASFTALPTGTNASLGQQLQFTITANTNNISSIELFSTGGSQGVVSNASTATFSVSAPYLGLGLHPFYAIVTDQAGHRFQTSTISYRIVPSIALTISGKPPVLTWSTIPGNQYNLQSTTNLTAGFQTLATVTATNSVIQWPISPTNRAEFYRVQLGP
jgi:hypothetical protein